MPLVSPNDGVNVDFTANADDLVADSERVIKELDKVKAAVKDNGRQLEEQARREQDALKKSSMSWTDFRSAYMVAVDVVRAGQQVWDATISKHLEYADSVRQLSQVSGASAEESSRLIQVLDDYGISAQSALTSTRALTKQGLAPSIETLAQLSDQYLKLGSAQAKNEFVLKNLGRSGLEYVEILNKGSDAIRAQGAAVADNLILNQQQLDDARRLEVAFDNLNDAIFGAGETFSTKLTPFLANATDGFLLLIGAGEKWIEQVKNGTWTEGGLDKILRETAADIKKNEEAMLAKKTATEEATEADIAATDAARDLSKTLSGLLSSMFAINSENEKYTDTLAGAEKKSADLAAEKNRLTLAMWEEQRAGKMTNDEYLKYVQQLDEITQKQDENTKAIADSAEEHKKAGEKRVYDLVQQRLAADGVIDSGEYEYLQDLAVAKGLVTKADAEQAKRESQAADQLVQNFSKTQPLMDEALSTMQQIAAYDGRIVSFGVNFSSSGMSAAAATSSVAVRTYGSNKPNGSYTPINWSSMNFHDRDSGGSGMAGTPYMIGTGAQPEVFIPQTNGQFIPKNQMGNTYNIVINNPKKETAENSIRQELKKLSYIGVAQ